MTTKAVKNMMVYQTTDYEKFKIIEGNRNLNKANLRKLISSMKEEQLIIPIIVNEKMEIIDGQHRYCGCVELGKPVYYIINEGYGLKQVKRANTVGVNWTNEDFLLTYMAEGNENYIAINDLKKEHGLQVNIILKIISAFLEKSTAHITNNFKNGALEVGLEEEWEGVKHFCNQLEMFSPYKEYKASGFISAFLKLYFHEDYSVEIMERQSRWITHFQPKARGSEYILEDFCRNVYSYRQTSNKIYYNRELQRFFK